MQDPGEPHTNQHEGLDETRMSGGDRATRLADHPVLTLNHYGPGKYDFGAGWGREGSEFILRVSPRLAVCTQVGRKETGPWQATPAQTAELQRFVVERLALDSRAEARALDFG